VAERVGVRRTADQHAADNRDPTKPWAAARADLICRSSRLPGSHVAVVDAGAGDRERARGNPDSAAGNPGRGDAGGRHPTFQLKPARPSAALKDVLVAQNRVEPVSEVGIGPDAEVFTQAPVLSAVGTCMERSASEIVWKTSRARRRVLFVGGKRWRMVRRYLGNDVNLRDFGGTLGATAVQGPKDNNGVLCIGVSCVSSTAVSR